MRIDVEVYKGPLSKEPMVQFADLVGFLDEVQSGLQDVKEFTNAVALNKDFKDKGGVTSPRYNGAPENWCNGLEPAGLWNQIDYFDCILLKKLVKYLYKGTLVDVCPEYYQPDSINVCREYSF